MHLYLVVIPAKLVLDSIGEWIPAFAGMTNIGVIMTFYGAIINFHFEISIVILNEALYSVFCHLERRERS